MKDFGAFPPDNYLPASVRKAIDKLIGLRERIEDAQEDIAALRAHVAEAETADIMEAANAIVAGKDEEPGSRHHDAAVQAVKTAERQHRALKAALPQVTAELQAAMASAADKINATADKAFDAATGAYIRAIEALVLARREWLESVAAKKYADQATHGTGGDAHYVMPNIDPADYRQFRGEVTTPTEALFAPPATWTPVVHHATHVQGLLMGRQIPSYASGNGIVVLEGDRDAALDAITSLSDWYEDGDGVTKATVVPPLHVTITTVPSVTDGMKQQCHWLRARRWSMSPA